MARLLAFTLLACAAFAFSLPWLDRPGTAALGIAFLAYATPRPRLSIASRIGAALRSGIALPTEDAGQTPPSLREPLEPYVTARVDLREPDEE